MELKCVNADSKHTEERQALRCLPLAEKSARTVIRVVSLASVPVVLPDTRHARVLSHSLLVIFFFQYQCANVTYVVENASELAYRSLTMTMVLDTSYKESR
jgi:hypothetical protein